MSDIRFSEGSATEVVEGVQPGDVPAGSTPSIGDADHDDLVLLAWLDASVVGYLAASTDMYGGLIVWEHFVVERCRDHGIGRRLLLEAARRAQPRSTITIDPTGDFAIERVAGYYSRLGFPATPTDEFKVSVPAHEVVDAIGERSETNTTLETILRRKQFDVVTIAPDAPMSEALTLLHDNRIGSVVVSPDGKTIGGVLSERDIVVGLHRDGTAMLDAKVSSYMTDDVISVEATELVSRVMELATIKRLRHLPVTKDGALMGVVSVGDLLMFRMREHDMRRDALPFRS